MMIDKDSRTKAMEKKKGTRDCESCQFSVELRQPNNPLEWVRICKWGPPAASLGPSQGGVGVFPLDKICPPGHWCFQWKAEEPQLQ